MYFPDDCNPLITAAFAAVQLPYYCCTAAVLLLYSRCGAAAVPVAVLLLLLIITATITYAYFFKENLLPWFQGGSSKGLPLTAYVLVALVENKDAPTVYIS